MADAETVIDATVKTGRDRILVEGHARTRETWVQYLPIVIEDVTFNTV